MKRFTGILILFLGLIFTGWRPAFAGWDPLANALGTVDVQDSIVFRSTVPPANVVTGTIQGGVTLNKVVISSAAGVDFSTGAVLSIYDSTGPATGLFAKFQAYTNVVTGGNYTWTVDKYLAQGFTMSLSSGLVAGDEGAQITCIYSKGRPSNYRVYSSSFMSVDTSTHVIQTGPTILKSIKVLNLGTGSSQTLDVYDAATVGTINANTNQKIQINTKVVGEYTFDALFLNGLTVNFKNTGTNAADILVTYVRTSPVPKDFEWYQIYFSSVAQTTQNVKTTPCVLGGLFNGVATANAQIQIYDSTGPATGNTFVFDGNQISNEKIPVILDKGLTYTTTGATAAPWSIMYRNVRTREPRTRSTP